MAGGFEAVVKLALDEFPDCVAIGFDDHAAFDDLRRLGHVALENNVLIPSRKVLITRRDGRFGHSGKNTFYVEVNRNLGKC
jgi:hypothetical protein